MTPIIVVDDDARVGKMVDTILRRKGYQVVTATDGSQALDYMEQVRPALVILDVMMPGLNGMQVCQKLRSDDDLGTVPVLFLSGRNAVEDRIQAFQAGADDYMSKPFDLRELELHVTALLRRSLGTNGDDPRMLEAGEMTLDLRSYQVQIEDKNVPLTPVEFELLKYLMNRPGEAIAAAELLEEVWNYYPGTGDPSVVRMQVMNLRTKIEPDPSSPKHICTVYRHGYVVPN